MALMKSKAECPYCGDVAAHRPWCVTNTKRSAIEELQDRAAGAVVNVSTPPATVLGTQIGGDHYTRQKIQPIEYIWANDLGFSEGNIIKYATRWRYKGGIKDLEKLVHHGNLLIEEARRREAAGEKFGLPSR